MSRKKKPYYPINQLCKVIDCEHKTAPYVELSEYLVERTNNVRNGILVLDDIKYTTKEGFIEWTQRAVPEYGDVLFTREAPAGETCLVPSGLKICMGQRMVLLRPNKDIINSHFLSFYLTSKACRREIYQYVIGSTVTRSNIDDILQIKIFCPSITEQEKIASFLGAVDRRLTQLRRKQELLQTYKRGVMQKIFSQQIRFKQADVSPFSTWQEKTLGQLTTRQTKKNDDQSISRVLTNSAIKGVINQQDYFDKNIANSENLAGYYVIEKGDYVYNPRISVNAPVGPINKNKIGLGVMSPLYTVFRFKTQENTFYEQYFKTSKWLKYMCSVANYGARHDRMNITTSDFMNLPLPYPEPEEQQKISNFITVIDQKIEALSRQFDQTEKFKKGLLQKMFV